MKKILSILFLLIFLFNLAGYFVIFKMMQYSARQEMITLIKKNIPDQELVKVVVPNCLIPSSSDFRFTEEGEFIYKGRYYDIVRQRSEGNNTIFYCINDTNEEKLFDGLNEHIKQNTEQNLPQKNRTASLLKNIIKESIPNNSTFLLCEQECFNVCFFYSSFLKEQFIAVLSPPPKI
jgi:hypothetical protein